MVYHGGANSRRIIQEYEFFYKRTAEARKRNIPKFDALITTYEGKISKNIRYITSHLLIYYVFFKVVVQEVEVLRKINFRVCVIDEAHRIKNRNCKLLQSGLLSLKMEHRVLLTGTPLQVSIFSLSNKQISHSFRTTFKNCALICICWHPVQTVILFSRFSLLNFLEPDQFANSEAFLQQFGQCQTEEQVQKLQEILKPMMLRRLKEDVEKELQPKEETIIEACFYDLVLFTFTLSSQVQLSNIQKKYYRAVLERNFTHLMKGTTPSLINTMMQLRKCCKWVLINILAYSSHYPNYSHPYLINGAEEQILTEFKQSNRAKSEEELQVIGLISSSGKLVLIDKLLPKLHADGHKVLIFSQMVRVLDLLEEYMNIKGFDYQIFIWIHNKYANANIR
jgi:chromodomain-helicase-DNA-binding protein 7